MFRIVKAFLAALVVVAAFAFLSPVTSADAPVPVHEVGDKVGFGASTDLGAVAAPLIVQLQQLDQQDDNITIHELEITGASDIWVTTEVVGSSSETYAIRSHSANGLKAHFIVNVTSNQFPAAGTHVGDASMGICVPPEFPTATETVFVESQIDFLVDSTGASNWTVSEFALADERTITSFELRATTTMRNVPTFGFNETLCEFTIAYEDSDITLTADVDLDIRVSYNPVLDLFNFPITNGETWPANSTQTLSGTVHGTIDLVGIDPDEEQDFFDNLNEALAGSGLAVSGLTGFPIVLEDITVMFFATPYLEDGVIHDISSPVNLSFAAEERQMTLADGPHTVYLIAQDLGYGLTGLCKSVYSPDHGFIVAYVCEFAPGVSFFELENVPADEAEQEIADTKQGYSLAPAAANPLADLFLKPPFLGFVLLGAIAIVVTALLVRRRRKPAAAAPARPPDEMQPPETPPGPPIGPS